MEMPTSCRTYVSVSVIFTVEASQTARKGTDMHILTDCVEVA